MTDRYLLEAMREVDAMFPDTPKISIPLCRPWCGGEWTGQAMSAGGKCCGVGSSYEGTWHAIAVCSEECYRRKGPVNRLEGEP